MLFLSDHIDRPLAPMKSLMDGVTGSAQRSFCAVYAFWKNKNLYAFISDCPSLLTVVRPHPNISWDLGQAQSGCSSVPIVVMTIRLFINNLPIV